MSEVQIKGPRARAADLRERYRLTAGDVAKATGADERTVRRWTSATDSRRSPVDDRIRRLEKIIAALADAGLNRTSVRAWLREPAEYLDQRSPLAALGDGDFDSVEQFVDVSTLGISVGRTTRGGSAHQQAPQRAAIRQ